MGNQIRPAARAGSFYPASASEVEKTCADWERGLAVNAASGRIFGGVVPHAGWQFSGGLAFRLFARFRELSLCRVILLGAVHLQSVVRPSIGDWRAWRSPLGELNIDRGFEAELLRQGLVDRCAAAHLGEHSIEVQLPMLAHIWPGMPIVPIAVPASEEALSFGKGLGDLLAVGAGAASTIIFASSDLTHYGQSYYRFAPAGSGQRALDYATANDCAFLDKVMDFDAKGALQVARDKRSACGAGAVAAAIEGSRCLGATKARLLEHTNSHDVSGGQAEQAENFVGYASLLFE